MDLKSTLLVYHTVYDSGKNLYVWSFVYINSTNTFSMPILFNFWFIQMLPFVQPIFAYIFLFNVFIYFEMLVSTSHFYILLYYITFFILFASFYRSFQPYTFLVYHSVFIIYLFIDLAFSRGHFSILFSSIFLYFMFNLSQFCLILLIYSFFLSFFLIRPFLKELWHTVFTILHTLTLCNIHILFYAYTFFIKLYAYKTYFMHITYIVLTQQA